MIENGRWENSDGKMPKNEWRKERATSCTTTSSIYLLSNQRRKDCFYDTQHFPVQVEDLAVMIIVGTTLLWSDIVLLIFKSET